MPCDVPFDKLTEFLAWLSLHGVEGQAYIKRMNDLSIKAKLKTATAADWDELDKFLKPFLTDAGKRKTIQDAIKKGEAVLNDALDNETLDDAGSGITARFATMATTWTGRPSRRPKGHKKA